MSFLDCSQIEESEDFQSMQDFTDLLNEDDLYPDQDEPQEDEEDPEAYYSDYADPWARQVGVQ
jgi:hypothetical protein